MNTMDNAKIIETLEKYTIYCYFEKLVDTKVDRIVLFSIFPFTAAANLSDPRYFAMIKDLSKISSLNSGKFLN